MTAEQVAERLAVSVRFVYDHATELGLVKLGRASRFDPEAVASYIERCRVGPPTPKTVTVTGRRSPRNPASRRPLLEPRTDLLLEDGREAA
jgi:excisionase family DNA binding protein